MVNVSPRQLEVFAAIATNGSVRAAAERLHLTQPAASMALSELERHLETPLFAREKGRLRMNERGRELLPLVQEVLDRLQEIQRRAAGQPRQLSGELRIGASNTVGNYRVGELLGAFVQAHPQVAVNLRVANTSDIVAAVRAHELDVGCVEGAIAHADMETRHWRNDALVVCAASGHGLAQQSRLSAQDFAGANWILREPGSATRAQSERLLAGLPPGQIVLELGQIEAIKQAVSAGLGIACLPAVAVAESVQSGRLKVLDTPFLTQERKLSLVLARDKYRGALVQAFLATLAADAGQVPAEPGQ